MTREDFEAQTVAAVDPGVLARAHADFMRAEAGHAIERPLARRTKQSQTVVAAFLPVFDKYTPFVDALTLSTRVVFLNFRLQPNARQRLKKELAREGLDDDALDSAIKLAAATVHVTEEEYNHVMFVRLVSDALNSRT